MTTTFRDGAERNKALGVWGAVAGSGGAAGVLLGGVLTDTLGWEWVLWVNVPIAARRGRARAGLIAESRSTLGEPHVRRGRRGLDHRLPDAAGVRAGRRGRRRVGIGQTIGLLAISALLLAVFVVVERRSEAPLVPFRIFRLRTLTGANVVGLLVGASLFSMFFFISLYMQQVLGYSPIKSGFSYLPLALTIILAAGHRVPARHPARLQARAADRAGVHRRGPDLVQPGVGRRRAT